VNAQSCQITRYCSGIAIQVWRGLPGREEGHETYDIANHCDDILALVGLLWRGSRSIEVALVVEVVVVKIAMGDDGGNARMRKYELE